MKTKAIITCLVTAATIILCSCSSGKAEEKKISSEIFAMDTVMTLTAFGDRAEEAVKAAEDEIYRLEHMFSAEDKSSDIFRLNQKKSIKLNEDTGYLMDKAVKIYKDTGGAYDMTVYPLMKLWGWGTDDHRVPSSDEIKKTLEYVGSDKLTLDSDIIKEEKNQGIDLGGIAKGYTGDRIMNIFREYGITSAIISLGGNVHCLGNKTDGSPWNCGITDPDQPDGEKLLGTVRVTDKAVITSGGYERFFRDEKTGKVYHHIMDPKTGYPAESGLISVTIISRDGALADGLSTACYVMGKDASVSYWKKHKNEFDMILVSSDKSIYVTPEIEKYWEKT